MADRKPTHNRTRVNINNVLKIERNYKKLSSETGINPRRLQSLRAGEKPTRSEANKIGSFVRYKLTVSSARLATVSPFSIKQINQKIAPTIHAKDSEEKKQRRLNHRVSNLHYEEVHNGGVITGNRRDGEKVVYYIIKIENLQTGETTIGHGFMPYSNAKFYTYGFTIMTPTEDRYGSNGEIYARVTFYFAPFDHPFEED